MNQTATFGVITSAGGSRAMQGTLRFLFLRTGVAGHFPLARETHSRPSRKAATGAGRSGLPRTPGTPAPLRYRHSAVQSLMPA